MTVGAWVCKMNKVKALLAKNGETTVSKSGNVILKSGKQYATPIQRKYGD